MKIRFYFKDDQNQASADNVERIAKVCLSPDDDDLVERRRYDFRTLWKLMKSNKMKLSGENVSKKNFKLSFKS